MLTRLLHHAARAVPSQCCACRAWGTARVCAACLGRFARDTPRCRTCALQLASEVSSGVDDDMGNAIATGPLQCGECLRHPGPLDACWAAVDYGYPWDALLARLKFQGQHGQGADPGAARTVADVMVLQANITMALQRASVIIPIPLSQPRLRQRGFNQALEISKHLLANNNGNGTGVGSALAKLRPELLLRTRDTASQVGLTRAERLQNLRHAFAVEPLKAAQLQNAHVVLVDDVTTTTATLCAAALALRTAGAAQVVGVVFARTPV